MRAEKLEITPFISNEHGKRKRAPYQWAQRTQRKSRHTRTGGTMGIKIGVCLGIFLLAVVLQLLFDPFGAASVETSGTGEDTGGGSDETLGRLRFVSGNQVSSVFSGLQRWNAPLIDATNVVTRDDHILELTAAAGDVVSCPASGEVREIGSDETFGAFLRIAHGNGLESIYYNMESVLVELGQPVQALDTLGTVGESGTLYVSVLQSGLEQPAENYISVQPGS